MDRPVPYLAGLLAVALVTIAVAGRRLRRAVAGAADVPLSPLTGGRRVGADYPERRGIVAEGTVAGEMDDLSAFARPGFDPDAVAPAVRRFYERTADYELAYAVRWHRPFRLGAALANRITSRVAQLNLPGPKDAGTARTGTARTGTARTGAARRLDSRFVPVAPDADPREGARAWVRTRADGTAVFVAIYAHHERDPSGDDPARADRAHGDPPDDPTRYVNIAVPLPGGNLSTVLRPENLAGGGLELTTFGGRHSEGGESGESDESGQDSGSDESGEASESGESGGSDEGDEGLYLVTPLGPVELPLDQRFRVRPADGSHDPAGDFRELTKELKNGTTVVATHEMWVFGRQFLTLRYAAGPERSR